MRKLKRLDVFMALAMAGLVAGFIQAEAHEPVWLKWLDGLLSREAYAVLLRVSCGVGIAGLAGLWWLARGDDERIDDYVNARHAWRTNLSPPPASPPEGDDLRRPSRPQ